MYLRTIDYFKEYLEKNGPFDVFIGFSNGACIIMSIIEYIQKGFIKTKIPKFVILAGSG